MRGVGVSHSIPPGVQEENTLHLDGVHNVAVIELCDSERPFHQKSSCLTQLTLGPYVVQIWSRNTPQTGPEQVVHEVEVIELDGSLSR